VTAQGLCELRAGKSAEAERSLARSYELDPGNPITGFNLATLLFRRGDLIRAQFYIRRLNNSELANSESLWLGIKVERRLENREAMKQLVDQLVKRYSQSKEMALFEKGSFDD
jgi:type IV pilus assembly protein PilF